MVRLIHQKIEVVVGADLAPISIPAKALGDRIA